MKPYIIQLILNQFFLNLMLTHMDNDIISKIQTKLDIHFPGETQVIIKNEELHHIEGVILIKGDTFEDEPQSINFSIL